jgi:hypothetical protein
MKAFQLFVKLTAYYAIIGIIIFAALSIFPVLREYLPVGGVEALISQADSNPLEGAARSATAQQVGTFGESLFWLTMAIIGALLTALPVSWVYMGIRTGEEYDQSLISTILILPVVVTGIVIIVQNSLALAFALAGIAGAVRFKNSLKSSGDALFILISVGTGLAAGIGAVELAIVMGIGFNYAFVVLWATEYGEREGMKRYMADLDPVEEPPSAPAAPAATAAPAAEPPAAPPSGTLPPP